MIKNQRKLRLIMLLLFMCIIVVILYIRFSKKVLVEQIRINSNKYPIIVCKTDVDDYHNFMFFIGELSNKKNKEKMKDYIKRKEIKRIIALIVPFFNPEFDRKRIVPRYKFQGYMSDFEILGNQYVCIHINNKYIYYKFTEVLNLDELEQMIELKETK